MADIKINGVTPSGFYYGGTPASAVYYGSTKLWEAAPAGAVIGGKTYPTVTMPDGHEWLAVNLDYAWTGLSVPTSGASSSSSPQAMYYNYDEATYGWSGLKYGLLYNGYAVTYLEANKETLCPGWHIPTRNEFATLVTAIGGWTSGAKLKSTTGWTNAGNGTDDYGFTAFPSGRFDALGFGGMASSWGVWTHSLASSNTKAYAITLAASSQDINASTYTLSTYQYSIRLIKDY